jgi:hypothetical protein
VTSHVLEHTYAPHEVFAAAASLQEPGAYLIVSVPNQEGEPSMGVLLFLPHLHSFTLTSLARLAARHGYEVADAKATTAKNLNVVFRRVEDAQPVAPAEQAFAAAVDKIVTGLDLDRRHVGRRRLWWMRRADVGGQVWAGPPAALGDRAWRRFVAAEQIDRPRSVLIAGIGLQARNDGVPIEVHYPDRIGLFFK